MQSVLDSCTPQNARQLIRDGAAVPTAGACAGYVQANLVMLPEEYAYEFLLFCVRNPKPCPLLEVTDKGAFESTLALGSDLRTDLPKYRVYRHGELIAQPHSLEQFWSEDLVSFLIGCSYTFESALLQAGVPVRHIEQRTVVPMYTTSIECTPAGRFRGRVVASMRPIPYQLVAKAVQVTSRYPGVHGAPVHIGEPLHIGVDVTKPEFGGQPVVIHSNEVPVFWACGVTPQAVATSQRLPFMITHAPGHMFITDVRNEHLAAL